MTMELLGLEGLSPFYDYVNNMRKRIACCEQKELIYREMEKYKEEITQGESIKIDLFSRLAVL